MKRCPHCGAFLPDKASFCVFCMRELAEKSAAPPLPSRKRKKRLRIACLILAGVLLFGAAGGGLFLLGRKPAPEPLAPDPDDPRTRVYASLSTFQTSYHYSMDMEAGSSDYFWSPWDMSLYKTGDGWSCYSCPGIFENESPRIYFKLDGTEVLVALYAVRDDEKGEVEKLVHHLSQFIYRNAEGSEDLYEILYPVPAAGFVPDASQPIQLTRSDYSLAERLGLSGEDPFQKDYTDAERCACFYRTASFPKYGEDNRFFEIHRTRYKDGETLNDYLYYFTFGEDRLP